MFTTRMCVKCCEHVRRNGLQEYSLCAKHAHERLKDRGDGIDYTLIRLMDDAFGKLEASENKSLLKKYLDRNLYEKLKYLKTPLGSTLFDCIRSGLENSDSQIGVYTPDPEALTTFAELFDPIIEEYHTGFSKTHIHPPKCFGDIDAFENLDPKGEYIVSTRVRCARTLHGFPLVPLMTEAQFRELEAKVSSALTGLTEDLKGTYFPLTGMTKLIQQQLIDDHFLFKGGDRFLQSANAYNFWPVGRGIFHNEGKTFLVWVNEEDHLRIISMKKGGDLGEVYRTFVKGVDAIEEKLKFSQHRRFGYVAFCPTNLGTAIRASVHIKLPKLGSNKEQLEKVADKFNLQVRGTHGEFTDAEGGVYDISNRRRMGMTEFEIVKEMYDGITELIKLEERLAQTQEYPDDIV